MKIPFIKDLKQVVTGRGLPLHAPLYTIRQGKEYDSPIVNVDTRILVRTHVDLHVSASLPQGAMPGEWETAKRNAVRAMCSHLYGPVEMEIRDVVRELWEIGVPDDAPAMVRLEALIKALRGEDAL